MNELNQQVISSLDKIITAQNLLQKALNQASCFEPCKLMVDKRLHLIEGIEKLSEALGEPIKLTNLTGSYPYRYSLDYKGVSVFQMTKLPLDLEG
ncbi:MAG: hypothetical protein GX896_09010 [Clostridiales bacterium]|nr:hypothetical protein [Clostridiales bacterium]